MTESSEEATFRKDNDRLGWDRISWIVSAVADGMASSFMILLFCKNNEMFEFLSIQSKSVRTYSVAYFFVSQTHITTLSVSTW